MVPWLTRRHYLVAVIGFIGVMLESRHAVGGYAVTEAHAENVRGLAGKKKVISITEAFSLRLSSNFDPGSVSYTYMCG